MTSASTSEHTGRRSVVVAPSTRGRVVVPPNGRIACRSDGEQPDALLRHELELAGMRR